MSPAATSETTASDIRTSHASFIQRARILSTEVSQLPLDAVVAALEVARDAGALTVLDLDVPRSDALNTSARRRLRSSPEDSRDTQALEGGGRRAHRSHGLARLARALKKVFVSRRGHH